MDKEAIFNEFKKKQEIKNDIVKSENITKEDVVKSVSKNKKRFKKNRKSTFNKEVTEEIKSLDKYEIWKENFLKEEVHKEFLELLEYYRNKNFNIIDNEEFLKNKFEHPEAKFVVMDPTPNETRLGKGGMTFLIKPLYTDEYNWFIKNVGTREEKPEEFIKYCIEKSVLFPNQKEEDLSKVAVGTILVLYRNILDLSNLTKVIRVLDI